MTNCCTVHCTLCSAAGPACRPRSHVEPKMAHSSGVRKAVDARESDIRTFGHLESSAAALNAQTHDHEGTFLYFFFNICFFFLALPGYGPSLFADPSTFGVVKSRRSTWKGHLGPEAHLVASTHRFAGLFRARSESRSATNSSSSSDLAPHFALRSELRFQSE